MREEGYAYVDHTADLRMTVRAETPEKLFCRAAEGMAEVLAGKKSRADLTLSDEVELSSVDLSALLVDFLSEVLLRSYEAGGVFPGVHIHKLGEGYIKATIRGRIVVQYEEDIKAVTYHEAEVKTDEQGWWNGLVIFDI